MQLDSAFTRRSVVRLVLLLACILFEPAWGAVSSELEAYPLRPPDTSSPRDTLSGFLEAAEAVFPPAMYRLAHLFASGTGVDQDPSAAFVWMHRAAHFGYPPAFDGLETVQATLSPEGLQAMTPRLDWRMP